MRPALSARPKARRQAGLGMVLAGLTAAGPALASGTLPMVPVTQDYGSFTACRAALAAQAAADRAAATPRQTAADGTTREVTLDTTGIGAGPADMGPETARYDAVLWYHHGRPDPALGQTEVSHSYEHRLMVCAGPVMTTTGETGYTLSTFEPAGGDGTP